MERRPHQQRSARRRTFPGSAWPVLLAVLCAGCGDGEKQRELRSGDITTWAGDGTQGHDGDGRFRTDSWLHHPMELVFEPGGGGTAYIVDWNNHNVRRVSEDGTLETVIGTPMPGDWPCQEPGNAENCEVPLDGAMVPTELALNHPMDVAIRPDGKVYLAAWHNHKLKLLDAGAKEVSIVAGDQLPGFAGDGEPAGEARLNFPVSLVIDDSGAVLIADQRNDRVRRIDPGGERTITTVVGSGGPGFGGDDGPATEAVLALSPYDQAGGADNPPPGGALALDAVGNLYVSDTYNHCVRRISPGPDGLVGVGDPHEEVIETVAGRCGESGYAGDGGPATAGLLHLPFDLEIGPEGRLYIADTMNHVVRRVELDTGTLVTAAGVGEPGYTGDGGPALEARLRMPYGLEIDAEGALFIVDTMNNRVRRVVP